MSKGFSKGCARGFVAFALLSAVLAVGVGLSVDGTAQMRAWAWALTLMQVAAMWAVGSRGIRGGWLVGAAIQPAWVTYALLTGQGGFIVGCVVSAAVQIMNYVRTYRGVVTPPETRRQIADAKVGGGKA